MAKSIHSKRHKYNRKHLCRNQHVTLPPASVTANDDGTNVHLDFSVPVVISGLIPLTVTGRRYVSQHQDSPTEATVEFNDSVEGLDYDLAPNSPSIRTMQGGSYNPIRGNFND